jgi:hypothetical protein
MLRGHAQRLATSDKRIAALTAAAAAHADAALPP